MKTPHTKLLCGTIGLMFCFTTPVKTLAVPSLTEFENKRIPSLGASVAKYGVSKSETSAVDVMRAVDAAINLSKTCHTSLLSTLDMLKENLQSFQSGGEGGFVNYIKVFTGIDQAGKLWQVFGETSVDLLTQTESGVPAESLARIVMVIATLYQYNNEIKAVVDEFLTALFDKVFSEAFITHLLNSCNLSRYMKTVNNIVRNFHIQNKVYQFFTRDMFGNKRWNLLLMNTQDAYILSLGRGIQLLFGIQGPDANSMQQRFSASRRRRVIDFDDLFNYINLLYSTGRSAQSLSNFIGRMIVPMTHNLSQHIAIMSPQDFINFYTRLSEVPVDQWLYFISGENLANSTDSNQINFNTLISCIRRGLSAYQVFNQAYGFLFGSTPIDINCAFEDSPIQNEFDEITGAGEVASSVQPTPTTVTISVPLPEETISEEELQAILNAHHWSRQYIIKYQNYLNERSISTSEVFHIKTFTGLIAIPVSKEFLQVIRDQRLTVTIPNVKNISNATEPTLRALHEYVDGGDASDIITHVSVLLDPENLLQFLPEALRNLIQEHEINPTLRVSIVSKHPLTGEVEVIWNIGTHKIILKFTFDVKETREKGWLSTKTVGSFASLSANDPDKDSIRYITLRIQ